MRSVALFDEEAGCFFPDFESGFDGVNVGDDVSVGVVGLELGVEGWGDGDLGGVGEKKGFENFRADLGVGV